MLLLRVPFLYVPFLLFTLELCSAGVFNTLICFTCLNLVSKFLFYLHSVSFEQTFLVCFFIYYYLTGHCKIYIIPFLLFKWIIWNNQAVVSTFLNSVCCYFFVFFSFDISFKLKYLLFVIFLYLSSFCYLP